MPAIVKFKIVLVTAPDLKTARRLVRAAVAARLIACANLIPQIESHYRWQGKVERGREVLMVLKTLGSRLGALEQFILAQHPYATGVSRAVGGGRRAGLSGMAVSELSPGTNDPGFGQVEAIATRRRRMSPREKKLSRSVGLVRRAEGAGPSDDPLLGYGVNHLLVGFCLR